MQNKNPKIMAHMVAYYPDKSESLKIALSLIEAGAGIIEVQFPFSDPTADGKFIERACTEAIKNGFNVENGFELVKTVHEKSAREAGVPIFIMSYANIVYFYGVERFVKMAKQSGASGLIIPDLPFDYDEGLYRAGKSCGIGIIPVITPSIDKERLKDILKLESEYIYTTLRLGITGQHTEINRKTINYLKNLSSYNVKILAGFGLSSKEQIEPLKNYIYAAVVGSALIKSIADNRDIPPHIAVKGKLKELIF